MVKQTFYSIVLGTLAIAGIYILVDKVTNYEKIIEIKEEYLISEEYLKEINNVFEEFEGYLRDINNKEKENVAKEALDKFNVITLNPKNEVDYEINIHMKNLIENFKEALRYQVVYEDSGKAEHKEHAKEYMREALGDVELIHAVFNKYNIK